MTRLRPVRLLIIIAAAAALTAPVFAGTTVAEHSPVVKCIVPLVGCPDLIVDGERFRPRIETRTFSSSHCDVQEGTTQPGTRTLLRFTFTTPNIGLADLFVGAPQGNPAFEYGPCHGHYHFKEYADYRLWTPEQFAEWDALRNADPNAQAHAVLAANPHLQPVKGDKRGFCVIDLIDASPIPTPPKYVFCSYQGVSVGWADEYHYSLSGQYVDITGLPSGNYVLEAEVNAEHLYEESNYANNRAARDVTI